jgi:hypothetical protein
MKYLLFIAASLWSLAGVAAYLEFPTPLEFIDYKFCFFLSTLLFVAFFMEESADEFD